MRIRLFHLFKEAAFILGIVLPCLTACSQSFTDSNLPIVIINTDGSVNIPDAPRVFANMKIIYKGPGVRNAVADQNDPTALNYNGRINIEIRGSSSQALDKKQYGLTTLKADNISNNNVSLLGMPQENDWVLNGLAFEPSLMRDHISYTLSRAIGEYAPRTVYCEVMINGSYRGLYMLQEKIKVDDNRVDVIKIDPDDNAMPDITGGYIVKADKVTSEDPSAWKMSSYLGSNNVDFIYEFPKPSEITLQQGNYIRQQFFGLADKANNNLISVGYPSMIDVPSFIHFMLINELAANVDAYQFSTFFHKDKRGKLRAGPLWDLNLTYGNDLFMWGLDRSKTNTWQFDNGDNIGAKFWKDLFNNSSFRCYLSKRWNALTQPGQPLNQTSINNLIDETTAQISEAVVRENAKWGTIGDHASRVNVVKDFLTQRIPWITASLGSFSSCNNIVVPPLVISRIMYNPSTNSLFPSSSDQEFVEIVNNSNEPVDMTGLYFSGTGFIYQFPAGYFFPPQGIIQLANKLETFGQRYGISAFGEFTRDLNNSNQKLTLADGFGNVIDEVHYSSQPPWPDASANGFHIKLKDINLDNGNPENWEPSNEALTTNVISGVEVEIQTDVFPNPFHEDIIIRSNEDILSVQIMNGNGQIIETILEGVRTLKIPTLDYRKGLYLITIKTQSQSIIRKVFKE